MHRWKIKSRRFAAESLPRTEGLDYPIALVGTENDLLSLNGVRQEVGQNSAAKLGLLGAFHTSAKSGEGIEDPFSGIVRGGRSRKGNAPLSDAKVANSDLDVDREILRPRRVAWTGNLKTKIRKFLS